MKTSSDRILTTLAGSLPRPKDLVDAMIAKDAGEAYDAAALEAQVEMAVREAVANQVAAGVDVVSDGEMSKISYVNYLTERIDGFGTTAPIAWSAQDMADHPGFAESLKDPGEAPAGDPPACNAPLAVKDTAPLERDLARFRAAVDASKPVEGFMNSASPGVVALFMANRHYKTEEAYIEALAEVLRPEYEAIVDAGFVLQIDCPDLAMSRHMAFAGRPLEDFQKAAAFNVETLNHATRNIAPEAMRLHICWGNYPGPHTHDVPFTDVADILFRVRPQALLFEGANPRHAHEWEDWQTAEIPDDKILVPGVIDTNTNHVEHPVLIAQRIARFADIVGRERVMAGTDCGFATSATRPRVFPSIVWAKLRAMAEGAALATERLWGKSAA